MKKPLAELERLMKTVAADGARASARFGVRLPDSHEAA